MPNFNPFAVDIIRECFKPDLIDRRGKPIGGGPQPAKFIHHQRGALAIVKTAGLRFKPLDIHHDLIASRGT